MGYCCTHRLLCMSEKRTIYEIPVNFQGESRAIRGMFKLRFFVEGLALAIVTFLIASRYLKGIDDLPLQITLMLLLCMGPFLFGCIGIGGDPITVAIAGFFKWLGSRKVMLYNQNARATTRAQGDVLIKKEEERKTIGDMTDSVKKALIRRPVQVYKEGENFEFADNEYLYDVYHQQAVQSELYTEEDMAEMEAEAIEWETMDTTEDDMPSSAEELFFDDVEAEETEAIPVRRGPIYELEGFDWESPDETEKTAENAPESRVENAEGEETPRPKKRKRKKRAPVSAANRRNDSENEPGEEAEK